MSQLIIEPDLSNAPPSMRQYLSDLKVLFMAHAANDDEKGMTRVESHLNALMIGNASGLCISWYCELP